MNRVLARIVFLVLILSIIPTLVAHSDLGRNKDYELIELGVSGVTTSSINKTHIVIDFCLREYAVEYLNGYTLVRIDNHSGYTAEPGEPELPYRFFEVKLPRWTKVIDIIVSNTEHSVQRINYIVKSSSNLLITRSDGEDEKSYSNELFSNNVYSLDNHYPGRLLDYLTGVDRDHRYVYIWFYPVQYNPVRQELLIIKRARIVITYENNNSFPAKNIPSELENIDYVIITSISLAREAERLADFYMSRGAYTKVVTIEWIYSNYDEAENITKYRGFYNNPFNGMWIDEYYELLKTNYNWSLSLRIINFLRNLSIHSSARYVLLFGSASVIPPSFYYLSFILYHYDSWNGWIPTDIFYASPDYDLFPEFYVARLPVSNNWEASRIVDKIISWYRAVEEDGYWFRNMVLAGGYSPGYIYFHNELVINSMIRDEILNRFNTRVLSKIDGTYNASAVLDVFRGNVGWFILLSQGLGDAFVDVEVVEGLRDLELVLLASIYDLQVLPYNPRVPVVLTTADMNGAWDTDLLTPPLHYFMPPSIGKELLISNAGGIAYIGSSRKTLSTYTYEFRRGAINVNDYGAPLLIRKIVEAYDEATSGKTTLGEIFWRGVREYLTSVRIGELVLTTVMSYTPLLGDPCLTIPVFSREDKSIIMDISVEQVIESDLINANTLFYRSFGEIPLIPETREYIYLYARLKGSIPNEVSAQVYRIYGWRLDREDLSRIRYLGEYRFNVSIAGRIGYVYGTIELSETVTGILLIRLRTADHEARLYVLSYGFRVYPEAAYAGSTVSITIYGLDVFYPPGAQAVVSFAGVFMGYATVDEYGYVRSSLLIPLVEPGFYTIKLSFPREYFYDSAVFPVEQAFSIRVIMSRTQVEIVDRVLELNKTLLALTTNLSNIWFILKELNSTNSAILEFIEKQLLSEVRGLREMSELLLINASKQLRNIIDEYDYRLKSIENNTNNVMTLAIINTVLLTILLILFITSIIKKKV